MMVKVQKLFAKTNLKVRVCGAKRNNESPSGAFKRQNGLAAARWRGLAPTSSSLPYSAKQRKSPCIPKTDAGAFFCLLQDDLAVFTGIHHKGAAGCQRAVDQAL
ncbi:MAG: hypothetical protein ACLT8U_11340, partial [Faecalibacterium sp.]